MNRKLQVLIACFAIFLLSFAVTGLVSGAVQREPEPVAAEETNNKTNAGYLLKTYNGTIGVYYGDSRDIPTVITDIQVESLRKVDQELLNDGIWTNSRDEMLQLLEDLGS